MMSYPLVALATMGVATAAGGAFQAGQSGPLRVTQVTWDFDNLERIGGSPFRALTPAELMAVGAP
jgi:hypothetical protein